MKVKLIKVWSHYLAAFEIKVIYILIIILISQIVLSLMSLLIKKLIMINLAYQILKLISQFYNLNIQAIQVLVSLMNYGFKILKVKKMKSKKVLKRK